MLWQNPCPKAAWGRKSLFQLAAWGDADHRISKDMAADRGGWTIPQCLNSGGLAWTGSGDRKENLKACLERVHFLQEALFHKLLSSSQIPALAGNHGFKHTSLWGTSHPNHCAKLVYIAWNHCWARSIFLAEKHANSKNKTFAKDKQFIHQAVKTMNRGGQATRLPLRYAYGWRSRWFRESRRLGELIWVLYMFNQMPWLSTGHILREQWCQLVAGGVFGSLMLQDQFLDLCTDSREAICLKKKNHPSSL